MSMVKVYIADVSVLREKDIYKKLYTRLDEARRCKAEQFLFEKDRRLSVGAGALLLYALKQEHVDDFSIGVQQYGKPYVVGRENLHFNLSHSGTKVMCALADREVGCDVEKLDVFDDELAAFVMTRQELDYIYSPKRDVGQREMFFRLWTLKESYMKAIGQGILLDPKSFGMEFVEDEIRVIPSADFGKFHFKEYRKNDGYCYSCCSLSGKFCHIMAEVDLRKI